MRTLPILGAAAYGWENRPGGDTLKAVFGPRLKQLQKARNAAGLQQLAKDIRQYVQMNQDLLADPAKKTGMDWAGAIEADARKLRGWVPPKQALSNRLVVPPVVVNNKTQLVVDRKVLAEVVDQAIADRRARK
jgi:hypothetical protein